MFPGFAAICEASIGSQLKVLEAAGCGIGPEGAEALAGAITLGSTLETLKLRDNSIEDEGAATLGSALASGQVSELDLSNNQVCLLPAFPPLDVLSQSYKPGWKLVSSLWLEQ